MQEKVPSGWLDCRFGTWRGAVRLGLSYLETGLGLAAMQRPRPADVRRIVFVCQGNICRSAFAEEVARKHGLAVASFGLATTTGLPADPQAQATARKLGIDLSAHRTTAAQDFEAQPGDLLLAMEVRQMRKLQRHPTLAGMPRALLGQWCRPAVPHLHDPFSLGDDYFLSCFKRIETAVARLALSFPSAKRSEQHSACPAETVPDQAVKTRNTVAVDQ